MSDAKSQQHGRERIARVFRYLKALNEHRNPAKRDLSEQPWTLWFRHLPDHPAIQRRFSNGDEETDFVLKGARPTFTQAPQPPPPIVDWLGGGWGGPGAGGTLYETKTNGAGPLRFDAGPRRVGAHQRWKTQQQNWAATERPARATMKVFEQLYELYGRIEREAEHIELVLGDGILSWKRLDGSIYHPILLQRIQLAFDPSVPEFTLIETGKEVELYSALFRSMPDIEPKVLARCREELDRGGFHPLGGTDTLEFLRRFVVQLSPRGQFAEGPPQKESEDPEIGRAPVLFLRTRTLGFATALLIGHLLAQGQSVLVTSHTTKALRVLRDHVVEKLRPLTVSVLESDIESRNQLEGSVSTIIERLTTGNPKKLEAEAEQLAAQRTELLAQLRKHRQDLFEARADEYRDVVFLKTKLTPIEAARKVAAEAQSHAWIPGSIQAGAPLPLSAAEIDELYASTEGLSVQDESELARLVPELKALVSPDEFEKIAEEHARLSKESRNYRPELWEAPLDAPISAALDKLLAKAVKAVEALDRERRWKIAAVAAGNEGGTARVEWDELVKMLDELIEQTADTKESALRHAPLLSGKIPLEEQRQITEEILAYFKKNKSLGKLALLTHGAWKRFIGETKVASGEPKSAAHFQALRAHILLAIMRRDLEGRWDRQMVPQGAPARAAR